MLRQSTVPCPLLRQLLIKRGHKRGVVVAAKRAKGSENKYGPTVALPQTDFDMRANSKIKEPEIQDFWEQQRIYEQLLENGEGMFTLHDGPPYANGDLHCGHALNKILKDFINKYHLMKGKKAKFVPGWDTHGLPIEMKVLQSMSGKEKAELSTLELRNKAYAYAVETMKNQREQFKRFGIWATWDQPYLTLSSDYEAAQLEVFAQMVQDGHIYRGRKPVHWSPSSRTALAESELEYPEGHTSPSCFVALEVIDGQERLGHEDAHLVIWTTTPWTLPANRAVAVNGALDYVLVDATDVDGRPKRLIVAEALSSALESKFETDFRLVSSFKGSDLEGLHYRHPFEADRIQPVVVGDDYITTESGTGLVHTAPGHGQEDYATGLKYGLEVFSPVDESGTFTESAGQFVGLKVLTTGNEAVVQNLIDRGMLLKSEPYGHKYPYDWRTKKPIIFRATDQWFASIDGFRERALEAIQVVDWIPSSGINRITAMTGSRSDWCISRQRKWGVPIPAFYDIDSGEPLMNEEVVRHVQGVVATQGSDAWWTLPVEELLPESMRHLARNLKKGEDTMDVWFDSGTSWAAVLDRDSSLQYPADLYLEGSDQHRGWFQSSLLTSVAVNDCAPYRRVLTHGFVLDERGRKMSKSLGNVVDPRMIVEGGSNQKHDPAYGADVLRLWVASVDYTSDVMIGRGILKQTAEIYRKIRGTLRFLLGNLDGFDPNRDALPFASLPTVDLFILRKLHRLCSNAEAAYEDFQFPKLYASVQRFVSTDLSNFYLDMAKDRLYIQLKDGYSRRACQTVLHELLMGLISCIAPVLPHLAEDVWRHLPFSMPQNSVFRSGWTRPKSEWIEHLSEKQIASWEAMMKLREVVTKALETAREHRFIGSSLEAKLFLNVPDVSTFEAALTDNGVDRLSFIFIVSQAKWSSSMEAEGASYCTKASIEDIGDVTVGVEKADGTKCERCWNYSPTVGDEASMPDLCHRCVLVLKQTSFELPTPAPEAMAQKT